MLKIIVINELPNNPEIPGRVVVEISEDEMMAWFLKHLETKVHKSEDTAQAQHEQALKDKKWFRKKPVFIHSLDQPQVMILARNSFLEMLAAMKRIATVRVLP